MFYIISHKLLTMAKSRIDSLEQSYKNLNNNYSILFRSENGRGAFLLEKYFKKVENILILGIEPTYLQHVLTSV